MVSEIGVNEQIQSEGYSNYQLQLPMLFLRRDCQSVRLLLLLYLFFFQCEYKGIPDFYSEGLSRLVYLILQKDPNRRPSAKYINEIILPRIAKKDQNKSLDTLSTLSSSNLG